MNWSSLGSANFSSGTATITDPNPSSIPALLPGARPLKALVGSSVRRLIAGVVVLACFSGCEKRVGEAVVLSKEHIAAAEATPANESGSSEPEDRPMADDEIAVDGFVMKSEVRGTSRDPRATKEEQWRIRVRTSDNNRSFRVNADPSQFEKLAEGDRVRVRYWVGKYTGTTWGGEIIR